MSSFDEIFDFVVVGSGGGSMCAALYLKSCGKSVLILEKTELAGGTTARSGGVMWIPVNPFMQRDGVEDSLEQATLYLDTLMARYPEAPAATAARRHTYLTEGPKMVEFLLDQGIRLTRVGYYPDYYSNLPGASVPGRTVVAELFDARQLGAWESRLRPNFLQMPVMLEEAALLPGFRVSWKARGMVLKMILRVVLGKLTGKHWVTAGAALQGRMLQAALGAGVDIRLETPVSELIGEEGGICGVVASHAGGSSRIGARCGVLVNAGGFAQNQAMRDRYQPGTSADWTFTCPGDSGEMIEEMMRHGAATAQMEEMVGHQCSLPPGVDKYDISPRSMQSLTAGPHAILVDGSGVRYQNEGGSYMDFCKGMLERNRMVPAVPSWTVFDSQAMKKYMVAGTMPGSRKPDQWFSEGYLKKSATLEGLAAQIRVPAETLRSTVERFNAFVEHNCDEDFHRGDSAYDRWLGDTFHRPNEALGKLERGPFYAVAVYPGDVGTYGGVMTDEHARVLREDGSAIPGLYATGVSTASVMGRCYPGAGSSVGPSFVWGYVAARHAAAAGD